MHSGPAFRSGTAEADLRGRAGRIGFAHVFAVTALRETARPSQNKPAPAGRLAGR